VNKLPDLTNLTRILCNPPKWNVSVNGIRIRGLTTFQLINPGHFRKKCLKEMVPGPCPSISKKEWHAHLEPLVLTAKRKNENTDA